MIKAIFHVNINCSNFERSLEFYKMLGFKVAIEIPEGGSDAMSTGLGVEGAVAHAAIMTLGDDPRGTRLDLIEWKNPRDEAKPYGRLNHLGIARVALYTKELRKVYQELKDKGVKFVSEPVVLNSGAAKALFACFHDPDGTYLELIEILS